MTILTEKLTTRTVSPFRFDVVGSFLRPQALKASRREFAANKLTAEELRTVEDREIIALIKREEAAGLHAITDGEFRRSWWHLDFFWGLNGIRKAMVDHGYTFNGEVTRPESAELVGKITGDHHPFVAHFKFLRDHLTDPATAKQTIPAPAQLLAELYRPENSAQTKRLYPNQAVLIADISAAYQTVVRDLYDAGLRVLQLDDCTWGMLAGFEHDRVHGDPRFKADQIAADKELYVTANNAAIAGFPKDLRVTTHDCRGNYHSTWASVGGYDSVADPLFTREQVDAYFLEYDSDRSGSFAPLVQVGPKQLVVLGLITSKDGKLEDKAAVIERIHEATKYVPLDRLCLSTQCGFASTEEGNELTEAQQWAKIALVKDIAETVWG